MTIKSITQELIPYLAAVFSDLLNCCSLGTFDAKIEQTGPNEMSVNGHKVKVYQDKEAKNFNWGDAGAEYIADCSGAYLTKEKAQAHV